jgi:hypothetical protein
MRSRPGPGWLPLLLAALCAPAHAAELRERILAVVDQAPVLLSEVRVRERLQGTAEAEALEGLIDEILMYRQATRLPQAALAPEEEERAFQDVRGKLPGASAADERNLRRLARRQATILKYVAFRFRPQVRVTEEAVRQAYEAETAGHPGAPPLEEAAPRLRERLMDAGLGESLEAWVKELRRSAEVRYVRPSGP